MRGSCNYKKQKQKPQEKHRGGERAQGCPKKIKKKKNHHGIWLKRRSEHTHAHTRRKNNKNRMGGERRWDKRGRKCCYAENDNTHTRSSRDATMIQWCTQSSSNTQRVKKQTLTDRGVRSKETDPTGKMTKDKRSVSMWRKRKKKTAAHTTGWRAKQHTHTHA